MTFKNREDGEGDVCVAAAGSLHPANTKVCIIGTAVISHDPLLLQQQPFPPLMSAASRSCVLSHFKQEAQGVTKTCDTDINSHTNTRIIINLPSDSDDSFADAASYVITRDHEVTKINGTNRSIDDVIST